MEPDHPDTIEEENSQALRSERELRGGLAYTAAGFLAAATGLLTDRAWSDWACGIGLATTLLGAAKMVRAAKGVGKEKPVAAAPRRPHPSITPPRIRSELDPGPPEP